MPTDDERCEVAARLREAWPEAGGMEEVWEVLDPILGTHDGPDVHKAWEQTFNRLSDLIEPQEITEDTSDGYHTFRQLYYQRMMLFAVLVKEHKELAWKTRRHEDGNPCFGGGWFLVTIETPAGPYGYHYEDKYWHLFGCDELPKAKPWDGYDESDVGRLMSLAAMGECAEEGGSDDDDDERHEAAARLRKTRGIMAFVEALGIDPDGDWCWTDFQEEI